MRTLYFVWGVIQNVGLVGLVRFVARRTAQDRSRPTPTVQSITGTVLVMAGLVLRVWGTWEFWAKGEGTPLLPPPTRLVTTGPYRYSRNPLYLGKLAMGAGFGLIHTSPILLAAVPALWAVLHWVLVPWEEQILQQRFGPTFQRYQDQVSRWVSFIE